MRISDWSSDVCSSDLALWQWLAVGVARDLHRRERFDCVHHVTYAGLRIPSFMGRLGVRVVFGPVGGGERAPWRLRWGCSLGGRPHDPLRAELGRASCRARVCQDEYIWVGGEPLKKKKTKTKHT